MTVVVVDTNVVLIANGQHQEISFDCTASCALRLQGVMRNGRLALDENFRILSEYQKKTTPKVGNRPGDAFVKWALQNHANVKHIDLISLDEHDERGFESFPDDSALTDFDPSDRKFVAVACSHPERPAILQAADSKWLGWAPALKAHGIEVEFLCPDDIAGFRARKRK